MRQASSRPLACARSASRSTVSSRDWRKSSSTVSSSSLPASILEKSSTSLMIANRFLPELCTVSAYLRWTLESPVSSSNSVMPSTPFIGVRISWLMRARKELLAWFAASAAPRACRRATSARLFCVMSRATAIVPMHSLVSLIKGAVATCKSICAPDSVSALMSYANLSPAARRDTCAASRLASGTSIASWWPTALACEYPSMAVAPAFQEVMIPLKSLVQIASLDCSTMVASSRFLDSLVPNDASRLSVWLAMLLKASAARRTSGAPCGAMRTERSPRLKRLALSARLRSVPRLPRKISQMNCSINNSVTATIWNCFTSCCHSRLSALTGVMRA